MLSCSCSCGIDAGCVEGPGWRSKAGGEDRGGLVSGEATETDLFLSCHLSCHRIGYHSPPLSLVKRGKGGNKFGTAPRNFRTSQCLSVAVLRFLRYDIFRWWSASQRTRYSPLGMRAARLPKAGEGGLEIPLFSLGRSFWKYSGAESGAAEQGSN